MTIKPAAAEELVPIEIRLLSMDINPRITTILAFLISTQPSGSLTKYDIISVVRIYLCIASYISPDGRVLLRVQVLRQIIC